MEKPLTIGKAHLIVQLENSTNDEITLLVFKGGLSSLKINNIHSSAGVMVSTSKGMKLSSELVIEDFIQLDSLGTGFGIDKVFAKSLKDAGFRAVATSKQELEEILDRQIEF